MNQPLPDLVAGSSRPNFDLGWQVRIAGTGTYLPRRRVESAEIEARVGVPSGWACMNSGVAVRHWASPDETASWMGAQAALRACAAAGVEPESVDLIVGASGSVERAIPDGAPLLQNALGLGRSGIPSFSVHATCLSFLAAFELAAERIHGGRIRRALVVSSEIASVALDFNAPEACTLFGDGAAACVLERSGDDDTGRVHRVEWITHGADLELTTVRGCGTFRHPNAADADPLDALFRMQGRATLRRASRLAPKLLERLGLDADARRALRWVVPHQTSRAGMNIVASMGFGDGAVVDILRETGNCIAASIPMALSRGIADGRIRRGDRGMLIGTGAGLSAAAIVMTY
ncbi:3-oxoacyl-[acyl-carrier-protein] synthase III C-terminal domain-containing protein [Cognatilysobacter terrigena]|uniref:3-oxoacyl-[acyl-carrier-protein] synthase III C-terminal domain-containing protein n=1 Tax=Cognatilysobacter terrigena TaxID=2488749 RepID=UPI00141529F6|nr:3-oxoacyl-[acyl-carrier-protein] synthase III C-terminal domain-containing protein [Lysobacter terrigena]